MILFLLINVLLFSFIKTEEQDNNSKILLNSDDMIRYKEASELRSLQNFACIDKTQSCNGHGECSADKTSCICDIGFATLPTSSSTQCNYQQKKQIVAFLMELFLGFGAGHFYTERYLTAGLKLGAFLYGIYIICLFPLSAKYLSEKFDNDCLVISISCLYYLCALGLAFWFIYDLVQFGMNKYKDGNNVDLLSWGVN
jgi:TM2 domain-containing membrane protein YozV